MRTYSLIVSSILFFSCNSAFIQPYQVSQDANLEIINENRSLLLEAASEINLVEMKRLKEKLITLEDSSYLTLFPEEIWAASYFLQDYNSILESAIELNSEHVLYLQSKIHPEEDSLLLVLGKQVIIHKASILEQIYESKQNSEEKDFLKLHLDYLTLDIENEAIEQASLNVQASEFLTTYPNSIYESYVREYIRVQYKPAKWHVSMDCFSGYSKFTGGLSSDFSNFVPFGIGMDFIHNRLVLGLRLSSGYNRNLSSITVEDEILQQNSLLYSNQTKASAGYYLINTNYLKLMPYAGFLVTEVSQSVFDQNLPDYREPKELDFNIAYSVGVNMDIYLKGPRRGDPVPDGYFIPFIRLGYAHIPNLKENIIGSVGGINHFTLGFGWFIEDFVRDY